MYHLDITKLYINTTTRKNNQQQRSTFSPFPRESIIKRHFHQGESMLQAWIKLCLCGVLGNDEK